MAIWQAVLVMAISNLLPVLSCHSPPAAEPYIEGMQVDVRRAILPKGHEQRQDTKLAQAAQHLLAGQDAAAQTLLEAVVQQEASSYQVQSTVVPSEVPLCNRNMCKLSENCAWGTHPMFQGFRFL